MTEYLTRTRIRASINHDANEITPAAGLTRGLATVEATVGQFDLAALVADLIRKRVAQTLFPGGDAAPSAAGG